MLYKALHPFDGKLYYKELATPYRALQLSNIKRIEGGIITFIKNILSAVTPIGVTLHSQPFLLTENWKERKAMKNEMLTLGAYLNFEELPDLLQSYLQDNCCYRIDNAPFYCIDNLSPIDSDFNFQFFVTAEDDKANNYLKFGTDIISISFNDFDDKVDYLDILNALEELRHIIKMKVTESIVESIKTEHYITCFE